MSANLWKDCLRWLVEANLIPLNHRIMWEDAQVIDLANLLRDGVILCQLLALLDPEGIDLREACLRPQISQFLCLKNIRLFLHTCLNRLHLAPGDLFEPHMLYDCSNFGRVLHTLSRVSHSPVAVSAGLKPFPEKLELVRSKDYYNEELYKNLEELTLETGSGTVANIANSLNSSNPSDQNPMALFDFPANNTSTVSVGTSTSGSPHSLGSNGTVRQSGRRTHEEDIYEDLCYVTLRNLQSAATGTGSNNLQPDKRDYCVKELLETEKNYVDALNMIQKFFMRPLKCSMGSEDRAVVFFQISQLADIHNAFYQELTEACQASTSSTVHKRISSCFTRWKDRFIVYGDYCANLPTAQNLLDTLCHKNEFFNTKILQYQKQANGGRFKLRDLLSVPMQRVLKYHLLLHELLRQTPETMSDAQNSIRTAYEHMLDLGQFINEVKRDAETLQIIADIQRSITDLEMPEQTQLQDYGRLVRDGELKVRSQDDHKLRQRYVFVFDKVLLMCKAMRGEQYSYRQALVLLDYELFEQLPPPLIGLLGGGSGVNVMTGGGLTGGEKNGFYLVHQLQHHVFTFYAKTDEQKRLWVLAIRTAMETACPPVPGATGSNANRVSVHSYIMATFENPAYCDHCVRLLKGRFFQGYRCVLCGCQVHKACIAQSGRCGPPQLPPRQPTNSPQLASPNLFADRTTQRLNQSCSSLSLQSADPAYVNLRLETYPWFAGVMDREYAHRTLKQLPHGSFLVRISCKQRGSFALSVNDAGEVKHMRIVRTENDRYYLSQSKSFDSIVQLVRWYEQHSLAESFVGLNIMLSYPYRTHRISPKHTPALLPSAELFSVMNSTNMSTNGIPSTATLSLCSPTSNCSFTLEPSSVSISGQQEFSNFHPPPLPPASSIRRLENGSIDLSSSNGTGIGQMFTPMVSVARAVALYRFTGESPSLLSFQKGDQIDVLSKAGEKKGWWKGRIGDNIGYFPYRYVTELD